MVRRTIKIIITAVLGCSPKQTVPNSCRADTGLNKRQNGMSGKFERSDFSLTFQLPSPRQANKLQSKAQKKEKRKG